MTKQELEKVAMRAMTKRLRELERVIDTGYLLKLCSMCTDVSGNCTICLAQPCSGFEDSRRRVIIYKGKRAQSERIKAAKEHHKALIERIKAKGYVYE